MLLRLCPSERTQEGREGSVRPGIALSYLHQLSPCKWVDRLWRGTVECRQVWLASPSAGGAAWWSVVGFSPFLHPSLRWYLMVSPTRRGKWVFQSAKHTLLTVGLWQSLGTSGLTSYGLQVILKSPSACFGTMLYLMGNAALEAAQNFLSYKQLASFPSLSLRHLFFFSITFFSSFFSAFSFLFPTPPLPSHCCRRHHRCHHHHLCHPAI